MSPPLFVAIAVVAAPQAAYGLRARPEYPCASPGTDGVYYESMSAEWSWHLSGQAIAYDRAIGDVSQLRVLNLDTGEERCITSGETYDTQPSWSPDGAEIAFVRGREEPRQRVHILRLADGAVRPFSASERPALYPAFSPDGSMIAFVRPAEPGSRQRFVVVHDLTAGEERVLFDSPFGLNNLMWTPDGRAVSFYSIDDDGWNDIYEAMADGSSVRRLTDNTVTDSYSAAYAPDGTRMVFGQGAEVSPYHRWFNYDLYEREAAGGTVRRLTWTHLPDDRARYSPDGETIGFVSRRTGYPEIYFMDADGTDLRQVTRQPASELTTRIREEGLDAAEAHLRGLRVADPDADPVAERAASVLTHQLLARGRVADALGVARMGAEVHPDSWSTQTALGRALLAAGRPDEARDAFRRSLEIFPNQYQIVFDLGSEQFLRTLDSIEGIYRDKGPAVFDLSHWLHRRGELLTAIRLLHRLDAAHPDDADVIGRLAYLQLTLGDHASALANYRRVLQLDPDRDDARCHVRRIAGLAGSGSGASLPAVEAPESRGRHILGGCQ